MLSIFSRPRLLVRLGFRTRSEVYKTSLLALGVKYTITLPIITTVHIMKNPVRLQKQLVFTVFNNDVIISEFIRPTCLPISCSLMTMNFTGVFLELMGWGDISDGMCRFSKPSRKCIPGDTPERFA